MTDRVSLVVNGRPISAGAGQTLLDAGLASGQAIPHDCATGQCDTCRVRIHSGSVDDAGTRIGDTVLACRARLTADIAIEFDEVPDVVRRAGIVDSVVELTAEIVEVTVALRKRLIYLPGQYLRVSFAGLPARDYSPTLRVDGSGELNELIFQIRRQPDGVVSPQLGGRIGRGTAVKVEGPFGTAFHRLGRGRLVVVSSGVGFAPAWAVARASRLREPERDLLVVAGTREPQNLYMRPALEWLRDRGGDDLDVQRSQPPPTPEPGGRPSICRGSHGTTRFWPPAPPRWSRRCSSWRPRPVRPATLIRSTPRHTSRTGARRPTRTSSSVFSSAWQVIGPLKRIRSPSGSSTTSSKQPSW